MNYIKDSILKLEPYSVPGRPAAVKLNQNESPFDWPPSVKVKILKKIRENRLESLSSGRKPGASYQAGRLCWTLSRRHPSGERLK